MRLCEDFPNHLMTQVFLARTSSVVCKPSGVTPLVNSRFAAVPNQARVKRTTGDHPARLNSFAPEVAPLV
jgi:hypothetical protein